MNNVISKIHLTTILLIAAVIWGLFLIIGGIAVSASWLRYLSTVTGIILLLLFVFDLWLWRLPFLQGWFVKRPILNGTWKTTIRSTWRDPSTKKSIEPIEGFMVIHQTYSSLSLRLLTQQSSSEIIGSTIQSFPDGRYIVSGIYRNEPRQLLRQKSPIHYGAFILEMAGRPVMSLKGHYWTDRNTSGEIELSNRHNGVDYDDNSAKKTKS